MSWAELFERADRYDVDVGRVRRALAERRERAAPADDADEDAQSTAADGDDTGGGTADPSPARVVADADVLAADLLVDGAAREALDGLRAHSWTTLVASDPLLDDAEAVVADLADPALAGDWRARVEAWRDPVVHPPGDHPALASAYRGGAMHVLTVDEDLRSASAGAAVREHVETSVKHPRAFAALFDPESLYAAVADGDYPGPDRDPRA